MTCNCLGSHRFAHPHRIGRLAMFEKTVSWTKEEEQSRLRPLGESGTVIRVVVIQSKPVKETDLDDRQRL